ncbi:MAG: hypothetical protein ACK4TN_03710, partial [Brevinematales bacterium]
MVEKVLRWFLVGLILMGMGCTVSGGGTSGDGSGNTGGGGVFDITPPQVSLLSPTNGQEFTGGFFHAS